MNSTSRIPNPPKWARRLGYAGLTPFLLLALLSWTAPDGYRGDILRALQAYAAVIASFVGALHWGRVMNESDVSPLKPSLTFSLSWGVFPSLFAWLSLLLNQSLGLLMLVLLLATCYLVDRTIYPRMNLSHWLALRFNLTFVAVLSCILGALSPI